MVSSVAGLTTGMDSVAVESTHLPLTKICRCSITSAPSETREPALGQLTYRSYIGTGVPFWEPIAWSGVLSMVAPPLIPALRARRPARPRRLAPLDPAGGPGGVCVPK